MKVWIVIPAYNEERMIGKVLRELKAEGWRNIIVVDDCSKDRTGSIAKRMGAVVVKHPYNMGLGAALRTGLAKAYRLGADCAVTFDADGQHDPKAVRKLVKALRSADLVIGVRKLVNPPLHKRIGNFILNLITKMLGGPLTDSQSGLRAFSRKALKRVQIRSNRYEVSSEILIQAQQKKLRIKEVQVKCFFTFYSRARGTTILSGIRIGIHLLRLKIQGCFRT